MILHPWVLTGTDNQKAIVKRALERIKFPFHELQFPKAPVEIGWMDLNTGFFSADFYQDEKVHMITAPKQWKARFHGGTDHGKRQVYGAMFPASGRLYIDIRLENYPELAMATVGAEIAHDADYFHPKFTEGKRERIHQLWHPGEVIDASHFHRGKWWEELDYSGEYWDLPAEAFMEMFVMMYSDIPFGISGNSHKTKPEMLPEAFRILGVPRTDAPLPEFWALRRRATVYHEEGHKTKNMVKVTDLTGLHPCKICKPGLQHKT